MKGNFQVEERSLEQITFIGAKMIQRCKAHGNILYLPTRNDLRISKKNCIKWKGLMDISKNINVD